MNKLTGILLALIVVLTLALGAVSLKGVFADENSANVPQTEQKKIPESLEKYETVSVDASTKIIYKDYAVVDEVFFDENEKQWYIQADDWALEGASWSAVKDMQGKIVKVEYYVVDGIDIVNSWGESEVEF